MEELFLYMRDCFRKSDFTKDENIVYDIFDIHKNLNDNKYNKRLLANLIISKQMIVDKNFRKKYREWLKYQDFKEEQKFNESEFEFMKEIVSHIDTTIFVGYKKCKNTDLLIDYMGYKKYLSLISNVYFIKTNDSNLNACLPLRTQNIIMLSSKENVTLLHELLHLKNISEKYAEFPSILGELSFASKYKLGDLSDRLEDISILKEITLKMFKKQNRLKYTVDLEYCIAILLAVPFIKNNGCSFENVLKVLDIINQYPNQDISFIMNKLNIKDTEIVESFKEYKKILIK